jgi:hypothetical protein
LKSLRSLFAIYSSITLDCRLARTRPSSAVHSLLCCIPIPLVLDSVLINFTDSRHIDAERTTQKTQLFYCCVVRTTEKTALPLLRGANCIKTLLQLRGTDHIENTSTDAWRVCWNVFTEPLPNNALSKSVTIELCAGICSKPFNLTGFKYFYRLRVFVYRLYHILAEICFIINLHSVSR